MYPSPPIEPLLSETEFVLVHILLNHRQKMYIPPFIAFIPPKEFYQLVLEKEMEIPSLQTNPRIRFYGLLVIKLVHTDNGLLVHFFLLSV